MTNPFDDFSARLHERMLPGSAKIEPHLPNDETIRSWPSRLKLQSQAAANGASSMATSAYHQAAPQVDRLRQSVIDTAAVGRRPRVGTLLAHQMQGMEAPVATDPPLEVKTAHHVLHSSLTGKGRVYLMDKEAAGYRRPEDVEHDAVDIGLAGGAAAGGATALGFGAVASGHEASRQRASDRIRQMLPTASRVDVPQAKNFASNVGFEGDIQRVDQMGPHSAGMFALSPEAMEGKIPMDQVRKGKGGVIGTPTNLLGTQVTTPNFFHELGHFENLRDTPEQTAMGHMRNARKPDSLFQSLFDTDEMSNSLMQEEANATRRARQTAKRLGHTFTQHDNQLLDHMLHTYRSGVHSDRNMTRAAVFGGIPMVAAGGAYLYRRNQKEEAVRQQQRAAFAARRGHTKTAQTLGGVAKTIGNRLANGFRKSPGLAPPVTQVLKKTQEAPAVLTALSRKPGGFDDFDAVREAHAKHMLEINQRMNMLWAEQKGYKPGIGQHSFRHRAHTG